MQPTSWKDKAGNIWNNKSWSYVQVAIHGSIIRPAAAAQQILEMPPLACQATAAMGLD
jgi:hypothetical protein